jgi:two-component system, NtrC family, response regulator AtoC
MLFVVGEGHVGSYPLIEGRALVIGRDPDCDVPLIHPKISRRHALVHAGDPVVFEDLGSTNGTLVGGRRIDPGTRTELLEGANVQLGPYVGVVLAVVGSAGGADPPRAAIPVADPIAAATSDVIARIARGTVSVLITGETGVGKEVLARTLHELSGRTGQLVAINCASLSEALLESELFGYEAGAFTGAGRAKPGLFELAEGGTVLLDEIGELPPELQAKLLRVLETRTVYRVGGTRPVQLDVRFLAATHRALTDEVAQGRFRRDLYFRVNGITMTIPPLRARRPAISALATELLAAATAGSARPPRLGTAALARLLQHDWPGNVRELRTVMERAALICDGDQIEEAHILLDSSSEAAQAEAAQAEAAPTGERERLLAVLEECAGNQTRAARKLGVSRTTFVHKLAVHRIKRPRS